MMKLIQSIRAAWIYSKASRLANSKQYIDALDILSRLEIGGEYSAKKALFEADILHRMGDLVKAEKKYLEFLSNGLNEISNAQDREYLDVYCRFYLSNVQRKLGGQEGSVTYREDLARAASTASSLTIAEFPP